MILCFTIGTLSQVKAETSTTETYRVGVNDVLNISVLKEQGLTGSYTVTSDGTITFHYIGTIYVKGMKLSKIEDLITKKLSDEYIKYPLVSVSLSSSGKKIIAFGVIRIHGEIRFQDNMTVMAGLALAGGATSDGLFGKIKVLRVKKGVTGEREVFVESILNYGAIVNSKVANTLLQVDDILIVEHNDTILIQGNVASRGRSVLEKDMTVVRALLQAGGVLKDGLFGKIKIRRKQEGKAGGYKDLVESKLDNGVIENKEVEDMLLQPDDILIVERNDTILIQGNVASRGLAILEKDMTVGRVLLQAGGISQDGLFGKIKIRRKQEGKAGGYKDLVESKLDDGVIENKEVEDMLLKPDDILIVERNKTFLIKGEVAQRGRFVLEEGMSVLRALLEAGGVSKDGLYGKIKIRRKQNGKAGGYKDLMESKLDDGVIENKEVEDMLLKPDDILIVDREKTYFIYGEANKTGEFILRNDMTVFKAITIAGGFTKWGAANRVKVLRKSKNNDGFELIRVNIDDVIKGDAAADVYLQAGDTIVVSSGVF